MKTTEMQLLFKFMNGMAWQKFYLEFVRTSNVRNPAGFWAVSANAWRRVVFPTPGKPVTNNFIVCNCCSHSPFAYQGYSKTYF